MGGGLHVSQSEHLYWNAIAIVASRLQPGLHDATLMKCRADTILGI
jgi:hypothetical protein